MTRGAGALSSVVLVTIFSVACGGDTRAAKPRATADGPSAPDLVFEQVVEGNQDLYVIPASGGVARRLTDHPALDGLPRFSPDGRSIVFCSLRDGHYQLYEVSADGGEAKPLRSNAFTEYQADRAPDGRLAFLSNAEGAESLWILDPTAGQARVLVRHGNGTIFGNPDWSADGRRIVFSSNWRIGHQIYVADAGTGDARRLSTLASGGCEPRFHPDGTKVVYVRRGHLGGDRSKLVEHDLASGKEIVLVDWPALNYDPVYSPDGAEIAFASNVAGEYQIYRQNLKTGGARQVTFGRGPSRYPDYRPR